MSCAECEELRELRRAIEALRRDFQRHVNPTHADDQEMVEAIARWMLDGTAFTAVELQRHAQRADGHLRRALQARGATNALRIGKLLQRLEGWDFDGARLQRSTRQSRGVLWYVASEKNAVHSGNGE